MSVNDSQIAKRCIGGSPNRKIGSKDKEKDEIISPLIEEIDLASDSEKDGSDDKSDDNKDVENEPPIQFLSMESDDDEDKVVYLDDSDPDIREKEALDGQRTRRMTCNVCDKAYVKKDAFVNHRIRHYALDHFKCPICQKGFTHLDICKTHESIEHCKESEIKLNIRPSPSTPCYPYCGEPIEGMYGPYEVELKYGRTEHNSMSQIVARAAIRNRDTNVELEEERMLQKRLLETEKQKRRSRFGPNTPERPRPTPLQISNVISLKDDVSTESMEASDDAEEYSGNKFFVCSICSFGTHDEKSMDSHCTKQHPTVSLKNAKQTISLGISESEEMKEKKAKEYLEKVSFLANLDLVPLMKPSEVRFTEEDTFVRKQKYRVCVSKNCDFYSIRTFDLKRHIQTSHPILFKKLKQRAIRKKEALKKKKKTAKSKMFSKFPPM